MKRHRAQQTTEVHRKHFQVRVCSLADAQPTAEEMPLWIDYPLVADPTEHPQIPPAPPITPSSPLVQWFGFGPGKWYEFCRRYRLELERQPQECERLLRVAREQSLLLCYELGDARHNIALALRQHLIHLECCHRWEAGLMIGGHAKPLKEEIARAGGLWFPRHKAWMMPDRATWQRIHDLLPGDF